MFCLHGDEELSVSGHFRLAHAGTIERPILLHKRIIFRNVGAVNQQDFIANNLVDGRCAVSRLTDFSRQVGWSWWLGELPTNVRQDSRHLRETTNCPTNSYLVTQVSADSQLYKLYNIWPYEGLVWSSQSTDVSIHRTVYVLQRTQLLVFACSFCS